MSQQSPRELISREEIRAVYARGEEAVIELVEGLVEKLGELEERVEALEGKDKKNSGCMRLSCGTLRIGAASPLAIRRGEALCAVGEAFPKGAVSVWRHAELRISSGAATPTSTACVAPIASTIQAAIVDSGISAGVYV